MAIQLRFVGQNAMDLYYRDFKGNTGFFELDDFIFRAALALAEFYQKSYDQKYNELRQEKSAKDELVGFDQDQLSSQEIEFKGNIGTISYPVMTFLSDKSNCGYQFLLPLKPWDVKFERASLDEEWQFDYLPESKRIFWYPKQGTIKAQKNSACTVQKAELLYIPSAMDREGKVFGEALIPDGVANTVTNMTVAAMRQLEAPVVKESLDGNENKVLQKEVNPK